MLVLMPQKRFPGMKIWTDKRGNSWTIRIHFQKIGGREECVGVEMWAGTPPDDQRSDRVPLRPLRAEDVRKPPLGKVIDEIRALAVTQAIASRDLDVETPLSPEAEEYLNQRVAAFAGSQPTGHPRIYGPDHFAEVAEVYREAWATTGKPLVAISKKWNVSKSAAAKWVARCRNEFDLLPKTDRGVVKITEEKS
jgi:hypothetical protein